MLIGLITKRQSSLPPSLCQAALGWHCIVDSPLVMCCCRRLQAAAACAASGLVEDAFQTGTVSSQTQEPLVRLQACLSHVIGQAATAVQEAPACTDPAFDPLANQDGRLLQDAVALACTLSQQVGPPSLPDDDSSKSRLCCCHTNDLPMQLTDPFLFLGAWPELMSGAAAARCSTPTLTVS